MRSLSPILRLIALGWLHFATWKLHPLSPYTSRAVILRANLERPIR